MKKFKTGDSVTFKSEKLQTVETYVWGESNNNYLIQHPQGMIFSDETKHEFTEFTGLVEGIKYIYANESELTGELDAPQEAQPIVMPKADEAVTIVLSRPALQTVYESLFMHIISIKQNRGLIMLQSGMEDAEFDSIIDNNEKAIEIFKKHGIVELEAP